MALNIAPPNLSGLAGLAGSRSGNLGLSVPGNLGLQALHQVQQQQQANQAAQIERARIQQQGLLGLQQQQIQRQGMNQQAAQANKQGLFAQNELDFRKQNAAQQGEQFQSEMAFKDRAAQQQAGQFQTQKKQETAVEQSKIEMAKLMSESQQSIKEKGAFASYALMSMKDAKTPEESKQIREEIIKEALEKGFIGEEEAASSLKMPISRFNMGLGYKLMQYGAVADHMKLNPQEKSSSSGGSEVILPDGTVVRSSSPTTPVKTDTQKDLISKQESLRTLRDVRDSFKKDYFEVQGQAGVSAAKTAEKWKGVPIVGTATDLVAEGLTGKNPEERSKLIQDYSGYLNQVEQYFLKFKHEITGAAAAEKEIADLRQATINMDMSPSEFMGALDHLTKKLVGETEFKKNILNKGIDTSPDPLFSQYRNDPRYKEWSDEKIKRALGV